MSGQIPQSDALSEAETDSLSEVMSRDPEGYSKQDRARIIEALRAQRARIAAAEAASGGEKKARALGGAKPPKLGAIATKTADDLGL